MTYVETDCTVTAPNGQTFTADGAVVTDDYALGYITSEDRRGTLTDWHGNPIGTYVIVCEWARNSQYGRSTMRSVEAQINGRTYWGRYGSDWAQAVKLHAKKGQDA